VEEKNIISILDSISETEAISALNTLSDTQDFENMGYKIQSGKADEQEMHDFLVYELIKNRLLKKWADKIGNQEKILMEKIFPILTNDKYNAGIKRSFVVVAEGYMRNIHNKKIVFSDKNRNLLMDKLINIFKDKSQPENIRSETAKLWSWTEKRSDVFERELPSIENDNNLLKSSAFMLTFNNAVKKEVLVDKMLIILDKNSETETVKEIARGLKRLSLDNPERKAKIKNKISQLKQNKKNKHLEEIYNEF